MRRLYRHVRDTVLTALVLLAFAVGDALMPEEDPEHAHLVEPEGLVLAAKVIFGVAMAAITLLVVSVLGLS